ncbi:MAG: hypothetical protein IJC97_01135 [Oscillospiraceae bacterium]|nr:hypothetical protein [Oscillospiraceae bacterium]
MVKNTKKYVSIFMSAIMSLGSNMFVCKTYAAEANIDMANVKMLIVDLANSHTPSLSNNENCSFSDENTVCDLTGRMGSSYYIVFGESASANKFVGNKDNTYQGTDNFKSDYKITTKISKNKTIKGMEASATYINGLSGVKNGVWGVQLDFPTENVDISSEVKYTIDVNLKCFSSGEDKDFIINMTLMPPEKIDRAAVMMAQNNTINVKYTNSVKLTQAGLTKMRATKKRDFTINFPNNVSIYIPRIVTQKKACVVGGGFETCPDMEDRAIKEAKSMFFVNVAGTMSDKMTISYPLEDAFEENDDEIKKWKDVTKAYVYPVNIEELAKKVKLSDNTNLIDFSRKLEATIKDGTATFTLIDGCIDPTKEIYMIALKQVSSSNFPTEVEVTTKKKSTTKKSTKSSSKKSTSKSSTTSTKTSK